MTENYRSPFIVIEGTDGSGKGTQTDMLENRIQAAGLDVVKFDFPRYGQPSAKLVEAYLNGELGDEKEVGSFAGSIYYAIDRFHAAKDIRIAQEAGSIVLSNRFIGSNMAHQGQKIDDDAKRLSYFNWIRELELNTLNIPEPDINFILLVDPGIAQSLVDKKAQRSYTDAKRDIHEASLSHLQRAYRVYQEMADIYPESFKIIDCVKNGKIMPIEEIHQEIWAQLQDYLPKF